MFILLRNSCHFHISQQGWNGMKLIYGNTYIVISCSAARFILEFKIRFPKTFFYYDYFFFDESVETSMKFWHSSLIKRVIILSNCEFWSPYKNFNLKRFVAWPLKENQFDGKKWKQSIFIVRFLFSIPDFRPDRLITIEI